MDLPSEVRLHNTLLGLKGGKGTLIRVSPDGFYETNMIFGGNTHRVLLPIQDTVIIFAEPEPSFSADVEIER